MGWMSELLMRGKYGSERVTGRIERRFAARFGWQFWLAVPRCGPQMLVSKALTAPE